MGEEGKDGCGDVGPHWAGATRPARDRGNASSTRVDESVYPLAHSPASPSSPLRLPSHHVSILRPRYAILLENTDEYLIVPLSALTVFSPDGHLFQVRSYHARSMCLY